MEPLSELKKKYLALMAKHQYDVMKSSLNGNFSCINSIAPILLSSAEKAISSIGFLKLRLNSRF